MAAAMMLKGQADSRAVAVPQLQARLQAMGAFLANTPETDVASAPGTANV